MNTMNPESRSLKGALFIGAAFLSIFAGIKMRDARDLTESRTETGFGPLLASRNNDIQIAEGDYFREISDLLKSSYVEPIKDDQKLVSGAVRGMVNSLRDLESQYFNAKEFAVYKKMRQGYFEGIGVYLAFRGGDVQEQAPSNRVDEDGEDTKLPRMTVVAVVPGGPADKAGVKIGDIVSSVDDHWVVNSELLMKFRKAQSDFQAKKIDFKTINDMRMDLRKKMDKSIMPIRVREKLCTGTTGVSKVIFERGGLEIPMTIQKMSTVVPSQTVGGAMTLIFDADAPARLGKAISGKTDLTIDLRNNVLGDFETMRKCLELVAPKGNYGVITNDRPENKAATPKTLSVTVGNPKPPKLTLLVDSSTQHSAEIFAIALSSKGLAKLQGTATGKDRVVSEVVELPDGSGYVLATGEYNASAPKGGAKK